MPVGEGQAPLSDFKVAGFDITGAKGDGDRPNSSVYFQDASTIAGLKKGMGVVAHQMPLTPGNRSIRAASISGLCQEKRFKMAGFRGIKTAT